MNSQLIFSFTISEKQFYKGNKRLIEQFRSKLKSVCKIYFNCLYLVGISSLFSTFPSLMAESHLNTGFFTSSVIKTINWVGVIKEVGRSK